MKTILFQGDSITDAGRGDGLGVGYVNQVAAKLFYEAPGEYDIINRGISGNRVLDLYARWKIDCLNLKPDVLTILVGVNDVWHELLYDNGVDTEKFEKFYRMLLDETKQALPEVKLILMEPYVLYGTATAEKWESFEKEVAEKRAVVQKIAKEYKLPLVPLQQIFDDAVKTAPQGWWCEDGVHPNLAGAELIAQSWMKVFKELD